MTSFTALYDSCVLYPATLRDMLMRLALTDLFRAKWSNDIHREWTSRLTAKRTDLKVAKIERTRQLMDRHVRDALVDGYQDLIPSLALPDADDRHVLAAAIVARADVIVTYDLRHFPTSALGHLGVEAQHPDDFIDHLFSLAYERVVGAVGEQRAALRNPAVTADEFIERVAKLKFTKTASHLRSASHLI